MKNRNLCIRLRRIGFANAPYYYIDVVQKCKKASAEPIECVGEFNPHPQSDGTKVVQLKFERIKYWLGRGLEPTDAVREILGKANLLPSVPRGLQVNKPLSEDEKAIAQESKEESRIYHRISKEMMAHVRDQGTVRGFKRKH